MSAAASSPRPRSSPRPGSAAPVLLDIARVRHELDLDARLALIPATASLRGVWFRMLNDALVDAGGGALEAFKHQMAPRPRWFFRLYSVADYLEELAIAAALIQPDDPHEGVRSIWRNAPKYSGFLHPGTFLRLLRPDPIEPMRWLARNHDHFANFGAFRLEERGPGYAVMHLREEYIWIETAHRGGCEGVLDACGVEGSVEVDLDDRFSGRLHVRWRPR